MKTVLAATLCIIALAWVIHPIANPTYFCQGGLLKESRGPFFQVRQVYQIFDGVGVMTVCSIEQKINRHPASREYDI